MLGVGRCVHQPLTENLLNFAIKSQLRHGNGDCLVIAQSSATIHSFRMFLSIDRMSSLSKLDEFFQQTLFFSNGVGRALF